MSDDLIKRLESAEGPSWEIDSDIYWLVGEWRNLGGGLHEHKATGRREIRNYSASPKYTASVDAALTLIPRGHLWQIKQGFQCQAVVWTIERDYDDRSPPVGTTTVHPALALCIAALKARAEQSPATNTADSGNPDTTAGATS